MFLFRSLILMLAVSPLFLFAQGTFTHMHMRVPDTEASAEWHAEFFNRVMGEGGPGPNVIYQNGTIGTMPNEGIAPSSEGGVIDHFGIAVADVDLAIERAIEMGASLKLAPQVGVTADRIAFIEDPWGVRMELLEDPVYLGINHIHMMAKDTDAMLEWFLEVFGGENIPERGKGRFHTVLYDDVWLHISSPNEGVTNEPSRGRAIDHVGFRVKSLGEFRTKLLASGYEPYLERPNPPGSDLMFFVGPEGIHFEIMEEVSN